MKRILIAIFVSASLAATIPLAAQGAKPGNSGNGGSKPEQGPKPGNPGKPEQGPKPSEPSNNGGNKPKPSEPSNNGGNKPKPSEPSNNGGNKPKPSEPIYPGYQKPKPVDNSNNKPSTIQSGKPVQLQPDYTLRKNRGQNGPIFDPRSGGSNYEGNSNANSKTVRGQLQFPEPKGIPVSINGRGSNDRGSLAFQIQRMEDYRNGELRRGYYHYDPYWNDCHFGFYGYVFDPFYSRNAWFSPYYWYPSVPGYLNSIVVRLGRGLTIIFYNNNLRWNYCGYDRGYGYGYGYGNNYDPYDRYYRYNHLDRSLSMLVDAFKYGDSNLLGELILNRSNISIYIDGQYSYDLRGEDYFDMTADLLSSVRTTDFRIESVRPSENNRYVRVNARHDYIDPWNRRQSVYLMFTLKNSGEDFQIIEAGTSRNNSYDR